MGPAGRRLPFGVWMQLLGPYTTPQPGGVQRTLSRLRISTRTRKTGQGSSGQEHWTRAKAGCQHKHQQGWGQPVRPWQPPSTPSDPYQTSMRDRPWAQSQPPLEALRGTQIRKQLPQSFTEQGGDGGAEGTQSPGPSHWRELASLLGERLGSLVELCSPALGCPRCRTTSGTPHHHPEKPAPVASNSILLLRPQPWAHRRGNGANWTVQSGNPEHTGVGRQVLRARGRAWRCPHSRTSVPETRWLSSGMTLSRTLHIAS